MADRLSVNTASREGPAALLAMRGVTKAFPGVRALDGVDFTLRAGEIHALMGENGAGKSTLIKVLTGAYRPERGTILLAGKEIAPRSPAHAQSLGISTVYQEINLIPDLSVAENLFLGRQPRRLGSINWKLMERQARAALARLRIEIDVKSPLASYSTAIQQLVAIARALDLSARILVLDEPTSSLDEKETEELFTVMRRLRGQGMGLLFVTHFIDQVYTVSDRITVLRNGRLVGEYARRGLPRMALIGKMIGRGENSAAQVTGKAPSRRGAAGEGFVEVRGLGRRGWLKPMDLRLRRGQVLGLAGLLGSGRTETARLLFGLTRADTGEVLIGKRRVRLTSPRRAIAERFGYMPEDRRRHGLVPELSLRENIILALQARRGLFGALSRKRQAEIARGFIEALRIDTTDVEKPIRHLSGGNQQKAILARWLATQADLLILDEPTRGIDVGAKEEIEKLIGSLAQRGVSILFISSELDEVIRVSDRVAVLRDRMKVAELSGDEVSGPRVMRAMAETDA